MKPTQLLRTVALALVAGALLILAHRPLHAATYTLSLSKQGQGSVSINPQKAAYNSGELVTLTANPDPGWRFDRWEATLPQVGWWDAAWSYRVPVTVAAGPYARRDMPAEIALNFTALLQSAGINEPVAAESLRVMEVNGSGSVIDSAVPFQFDKGPGYNANTKAAGNLIFMVKGSTPANATRTYHVYFAPPAAGIPPATVSPQLAVDSNAFDEGQDSFKVTTAVAKYYYQKQGAGFSSILDKDDNDWVGYKPDGGADGAYRGIPNMPNNFHPGITTGQSTLLSSGPLKAVIRSVMTNNNYAITWTFYPAWATMRVERFDEAYWFLYEGTPGGVLDKATDFIVRSDGTKTSAAQSWTGDLPDPEWLYFADPGVSRAMFFVHHEDDDLVDSYFQLQNQMTVFGFGRQNLLPFMTDIPQTFTLGLMDETNYLPAKTIIDGVFRPLAVTAGQLQQPGPSQNVLEKENPFQVTMNGDVTVKAVFAAESYALTVNKSGQGSVIVVPQKASYSYGDEVTLTAIPAAGWLFDSWSGAVTGSAPQVILTMDGNETVTAAFAPEPEVSLTVEVEGSGTVEGLPPAPPKYNQQISLNAVPEPGWAFAGWSGDLVSQDAQLEFTLTEPTQLLATFEPIPPVTVTVNVTGSGTVARQPAGSVQPGAEVTFTALPAPGWQFAGWSGALQGTANPAKLVIETDTTITATFTEIPPEPVPQRMFVPLVRG